MVITGAEVALTKAFGKVLSGLKELYHEMLESGVDKVIEFRETSSPVLHQLLIR
jgi:hypothetical protein